MGLLDDAIREHLDLKRRRGADPSEVEQAEREALGPVRRGPEEAEPSEPQPEQALPYDEEQGALYDDEEEGDWGEAFDEEGQQGPRGVFDEPFAEDDEPGFTPDRHRHDPPAANSGHVEDQPTQHMSIEPGEPADEDDHFEDVQGAASPPPHPAPPPPEDRPRPRKGQPAGGETVEYDVEPAMGAEKGKGDADEDVLEETPEFLQDTPDHDRLWFEQRPPRDFDFDG